MFEWWKWGEDEGGFEKEEGRGGGKCWEWRDEEEGKGGGGGGKYWEWCDNVGDGDGGDVSKEETAARMASWTLNW